MGDKDGKFQLTMQDGDKVKASQTYHHPITYKGMTDKITRTVTFTADEKDGQILISQKTKLFLQDRTMLKNGDQFSKQITDIDGDITRAEFTVKEVSVGDYIATGKITYNQFSENWNQKVSGRSFPDYQGKTVKISELNTQVSFVYDLDNNLVGLEGEYSNHSETVISEIHDIDLPSSIEVEIANPDYKGKGVLLNIGNSEDPSNKNIEQVILLNDKNSMGFDAVSKIIILKQAQVLSATSIHTGKMSLEGSSAVGGAGGESEDNYIAFNLENKQIVIQENNIFTMQYNEKSQTTEWTITNDYLQNMSEQSVQFKNADGSTVRIEAGATVKAENGSLKHDMYGQARDYTDSVASFGTTVKEKGIGVVTAAVGWLGYAIYAGGKKLRELTPGATQEYINENNERIDFVKDMTTAGVNIYNSTNKKWDDMGRWEIADVVSIPVQIATLFTGVGTLFKGISAVRTGLGVGLTRGLRAAVTSASKSAIKIAKVGSFAKEAGITGLNIGMGYMGFDIAISLARGQGFLSAKDLGKSFITGFGLGVGLTSLYGIGAKLSSRIASLKATGKLSGVSEGITKLSKSFPRIANFAKGGMSMVAGGIGFTALTAVQRALAGEEFNSSDIIKTFAVGALLIKFINTKVGQKFFGKKSDGYFTKVGNEMTAISSGKTPSYNISELAFGGAKQFLAVGPTFFAFDTMISNGIALGKDAWNWAVNGENFDYEFGWEGKESGMGFFQSAGVSILNMGKMGLFLGPVMPVFQNVGVGKTAEGMAKEQAVFSKMSGFQKFTKTYLKDPATISRKLAVYNHAAQLAIPLLNKLPGASAFLPQDEEGIKLMASEIAFFMLMAGRHSYQIRTEDQMRYFRTNISDADIVGNRVVIDPNDSTKLKLQDFEVAKESVVQTNSKDSANSGPVSAKEALINQLKSQSDLMLTDPQFVQSKGVESTTAKAKAPETVSEAQGKPVSNELQQLALNSLMSKYSPKQIAAMNESMVVNEGSKMKQEWLKNNFPEIASSLDAKFENSLTANSEGPSKAIVQEAKNADYATVTDMASNNVKNLYEAVSKNLALNILNNADTKDIARIANGDALVLSDKNSGVKLSDILPKNMRAQFEGWKVDTGLKDMLKNGLVSRISTESLLEYTNKSISEISDADIKAEVVSKFTEDLGLKPIHEASNQTLVESVLKEKVKDLNNAFEVKNNMSGMVQDKAITTDADRKKVGLNKVDSEKVPEGATLSTINSLINKSSIQSFFSSLRGQDGFISLRSAPESKYTRQLKSLAAVLKNRQAAYDVARLSLDLTKSQSGTSQYNKLQTKLVEANAKQQQASLKLALADPLLKQAAQIEDINSGLRHIIDTGGNFLGLSSSQKTALFGDLSRKDQRIKFRDLQQTLKNTAKDKATIKDVRDALIEKAEARSNLEQNIIKHGVSSVEAGKSWVTLVTADTVVTRTINGEKLSKEKKAEIRIKTNKDHTTMSGEIAKLPAKVKQDIIGLNYRGYLNGKIENILTENNIGKLLSDNNITGTAKDKIIKGLKGVEGKEGLREKLNSEEDRTSYREWDTVRNKADFNQHFELTKSESTKNTENFREALFDQLSEASSLDGMLNLNKGNKENIYKNATDSIASKKNLTAEQALVFMDRLISDVMGHEAKIDSNGKTVEGKARGLKPEQVEGLIAFLEGKHIELDAGGGKTEVAVTYMIAMSLIHGSDFKGIILTNTEANVKDIVSRPFAGTEKGKGLLEDKTVTTKDMAAKAGGLEFVNGSELFKNRNYTKLLETLKDSKKVLVLDYTSFGHMHNLYTEKPEIVAEIDKVNCILADEIHTSLTGKSSYISSGQGESVGFGRINKIEGIIGELKKTNPVSEYSQIKGQGETVFYSDKVDDIGISESLRTRLLKDGVTGKDGRNYKVTKEEIRSVLEGMRDFTKEANARSWGVGKSEKMIYPTNESGELQKNSRISDVDYVLTLGLEVNAKARESGEIDKVKLENIKKAETDKHTSLLEIFDKRSAEILGMTATAEGRISLINSSLGSEVKTISRTQFDIKKNMKLLDGIQGGENSLIAKINNRSKDKSMVDGNIMIASADKLTRNEVFDLLKGREDLEIYRVEPNAAYRVDANGKEVPVDFSKMYKAADTKSIDGKTKVFIINERGFTGTDWRGKLNQFILDNKMELTETLFTQLAARVGRTNGKGRFEAARFLLLDKKTSQAAEDKISEVMKPENSQTKDALREMWSAKDSLYKDQKASKLLEDFSSKPSEMSIKDKFALNLKINEAVERSQAIEFSIEETLKSKILIKFLKAMSRDAIIKSEGNGEIIDNMLKKVINAGSKGDVSWSQKEFKTREKIIKEIFNRVLDSSAENLGTLKAQVKGERTEGVLDSMLKEINNARDGSYKTIEPAAKGKTYKDALHVDEMLSVAKTMEEHILPRTGTPEKARTISSKVVAERVIDVCKGKIDEAGFEKIINEFESGSRQGNTSIALTLAPTYAGAVLNNSGLDEKTKKQLSQKLMTLSYQLLYGESSDKQNLEQIIIQAESLKNELPANLSDSKKQEISDLFVLAFNPMLTKETINDVLNAYSAIEAVDPKLAVDNKKSSFDAMYHIAKADNKQIAFSGFIIDNTDDEQKAKAMIDLKKNNPLNKEFDEMTFSEIGQLGRTNNLSQAEVTAVFEMDSAEQLSGVFAFSETLPEELKTGLSNMRVKDIKNILSESSDPAYALRKIIVQVIQGVKSEGWQNIAESINNLSGKSTLGDVSDLENKIMAMMNIPASKAEPQAGSVKLFVFNLVAPGITEKGIEKIKDIKSALVQAASVQTIPENIVSGLGSAVAELQADIKSGKISKENISADTLAAKLKLKVKDISDDQALAFSNMFIDRIKPKADDLVAELFSINENDNPKINGLFVKAELENQVVKVAHGSAEPFEMTTETLLNIVGVEAAKLRDDGKEITAENLETSLIALDIVVPNEKISALCKTIIDFAKSEALAKNFMNSPEIKTDNLVKPAGQVEALSNLVKNISVAELDNSQNMSKEDLTNMISLLGQDQAGLESLNVKEIAGMEKAMGNFYNTAVEKTEQKLDLINWLAGTNITKSEYHFMLGNKHNKAGNSIEAKKEFNLVVADPEAKPENLVAAHYVLFTFNLKQTELSEAEKNLNSISNLLIKGDLRKAENIDTMLKETASLYFNLGDISLDQGKIKAMELKFEGLKLLTLIQDGTMVPAVDAAIKEVGNEFVHNLKADTVLEYMDVLINGIGENVNKLSGSSKAEAHLLKGQIYTAMGYSASAIIEYNKAVESTPVESFTHQGALIGLVKAYTRSGDKQQAIETIEQGLSSEGVSLSFKQLVFEIVKKEIGQIDTASTVLNSILQDDTSLDNRTQAAGYYIARQLNSNNSLDESRSIETILSGFAINEPALVAAFKDFVVSLKDASNQGEILNTEAVEQSFAPIKVLTKAKNSSITENKTQEHEITQEFKLKHSEFVNASTRSRATENQRNTVAAYDIADAIVTNKDESVTDKELEIKLKGYGITDKTVTAEFKGLRDMLLSERNSSTAGPAAYKTILAGFNSKDEDAGYNAAINYITARAENNAGISTAEAQDMLDLFKVKSPGNTEKANRLVKALNKNSQLSADKQLPVKTVVSRWTSENNIINTFNEMSNKLKTGKMKSNSNTRAEVASYDLASRVIKGESTNSLLGDYKINKKEEQSRFGTLEEILSSDNVSLVGHKNILDGFNSTFELAGYNAAINYITARAENNTLITNDEAKIMLDLFKVKSPGNTEKANRLVKALNKNSELLSEKQSVQSVVSNWTSENSIINTAEENSTALKSGKLENSKDNRAEVASYDLASRVIKGEKTTAITTEYKLDKKDQARLGTLEKILSSDDASPATYRSILIGFNSKDEDAGYNAAIGYIISRAENNTGISTAEAQDMLDLFKVKSPGNTEKANRLIKALNKNSQLSADKQLLVKTVFLRWTSENSIINTANLKLNALKSGKLENSKDNRSEVASYDLASRVIKGENTKNIAGDYKLEKDQARFQTLERVLSSNNVLPSEYEAILTGFNSKDEAAGYNAAINYITARAENNVEVSTEETQDALGLFQVKSSEKQSNVNKFVDGLNKNSQMINQRKQQVQEQEKIQAKVNSVLTSLNESVKALYIGDIQSVKEQFNQIVSSVADDPGLSAIIVSKLESVSMLIIKPENKDSNKFEKVVYLFEIMEQVNDNISKADSVSNKQISEKIESNEIYRDAQYNVVMKTIQNGIKLFDQGVDLVEQRDAATDPGVKASLKDAAITVYLKAAETFGQALEQTGKFTSNPREDILKAAAQFNKGLSNTQANNLRGARNDFDQFKELVLAMDQPPVTLIKRMNTSEEIKALITSEELTSADVKMSDDPRLGALMGKPGQTLVFGEKKGDKLVLSSILNNGDNVTMEIDLESKQLNLADLDKFIGAVMKEAGKNLKADEMDTLEAIIKIAKDEGIYLLKSNPENISGFANRKLELFVANKLVNPKGQNKDLIAGMAVIHEAAEAYFNTEGSQKLPEGVSSHTFTRGGGKDARNALAGLGKETLAKITTPEALSEKLSSNMDRDLTTDEVFLIKHNAALNRPVNEWLNGFGDAISADGMALLSGALAQLKADNPNTYSSSDIQQTPNKVFNDALIDKIIGVTPSPDTLATLNKIAGIVDGNPITQEEGIGTLPGVHSFEISKSSV
ncbi:MAG: hypothetical protein KKD05_10735 [Candidatus Omnitrophica bacterium]|nr:hypothetical protein [Candidatus Omnitrophota bacterium]